MFMEFFTSFEEQTSKFHRKSQQMHNLLVEH